MTLLPARTVTRFLSVMPGISAIEIYLRLGVTALVIRDRLGDTLQAVVSLRLLASKGGPALAVRRGDHARHAHDPRVRPPVRSVGSPS